MMRFIAKLFGAGRRLSELEKLVLGYVRERLEEPLVSLWDEQLAAINKVQRLPEGVEVDFYRMKGGRPTFPEELAFPNKTAELLLANVRVELTGVKLTAKIWCVRGFLFSIEYGGSSRYFVEAAGMDPMPAFKLSCDLKADLASEYR